jgi:hypothetical protein
MDNEASELAEKQSAKINKHGGKRGNSGGRRSGAGRKKGSPNKLTAVLKAAIMAAFDEVGGADWRSSLRAASAPEGARDQATRPDQACALVCL